MLNFIECAFLTSMLALNAQSISSDNNYTSFNITTNDIMLKMVVNDTLLDEFKSFYYVFNFTGNFNIYNDNSSILTFDNVNLRAGYNTEIMDISQPLEYDYNGFRGLDLTFEDTSGTWDSLALETISIRPVLNNISNYARFEILHNNVAIVNISVPTGFLSVDYDASFYSQVDFKLIDIRDDLLLLTNINSNYIKGYNNGLIDGEDKGYFKGYNNGYNEGYNRGINTDETVFTIFNGILNIALVPINFFLSIFNFSILGINIKEFVMALLTVAVVLVIVKLIIGAKGGSQ